MFWHPTGWAGSWSACAGRTPISGMNEYPTPWQRKMMWSALAALSLVTIGAVAVGLVWLISTVIGFLQPILVPFAIAAVMAYLLEPVVSWIVRLGTSRQRAVLSVFAVVTIAFAGVMLWIIPAIWIQTSNLVRRVPAYQDRIEAKVGQFNDWARSLTQKYNDWAHSMDQKYGVRVPEIPPTIRNPLAGGGGEEEAENAKSETKPGEAPRAVGGAAAPAAQLNTGPPKSAPAALDLQDILKSWLRTSLPALPRKMWEFIANGVGGFLGGFWFLVSMVIVPIFLYYFLTEAKNISESWGDYLPLRASAFKDEVVSAVNEINNYLIAFFRGQLLVSLINGTITGVGLVVMGLDFGLLIGITLCFLGLIPYLGIILCLIPSVIIASVQSSPWFLHGTAWWVFPVIITSFFWAVNQLDGWFITPKIVGGSVGLHPMTVIASVFVWGFLLGGLLGAILAVPLTATVKVLLRRYIWQRRINLEPSEITEETFAVQQAQEGVISSETVVAK
jgi:predicted PurR-regulated permease PerM